MVADVLPELENEGLLLAVNDLFDEPVIQNPYGSPALEVEEAYEDHGAGFQWGSSFTLDGELAETLAAGGIRFFPWHAGGGEIPGKKVLRRHFQGALRRSTNLQVGRALIRVIRFSVDRADMDDLLQEKP